MLEQRIEELTTVLERLRAEVARCADVMERQAGGESMPASEAPEVPEVQDEAPAEKPKRRGRPRKVKDEPQEVPTLSADEVRKRLIDLPREVVIDALHRLGCEKFSDVEPKNYELLLKTAAEILEQTAAVEAEDDPWT